MPKLHQAVLKGEKGNMYHLINSGADINQLNDQGKSPLDLAFGGSEDEFEKAKWLQYFHWGKLGRGILSRKMNNNKVDDDNNEKEQEETHSLICADVEQWQSWKNSVLRISPQTLIQRPDFLITELDAGVIFIKDSPTKHHEMYYKHYFGKRWNTECQRNNFCVEYDLLEPDALQENASNVVEKSSYCKNIASIDSASSLIVQVDPTMTNDSFIDPDTDPSGSKKSKPTRQFNLLELIIKGQCEELLNHPAVLMFIRKKWTLALITCLPFLVLTLFRVVSISVLMVKAPMHAGVVNGSSEYFPDDYTQNIILSSIILFCSMIGIAIEIFEICKQHTQYLGLDHGSLAYNCLDWFCYFSGALVATSVILYRYLIIGSWVWNLGVVSVLLSWIDLIFFARMVPLIGIYVVMVEMVFKSFLKFFVVFALFIISFAITFHIILDQQKAFRHVGYSIIKTWVMMTGEMDYENVVDAEFEEELYTESWITYTVFVFFLIFLSLIVMNLLTGIAVSDVQKLERDSTCTVIKMQAQFSLMAEDIFRIIWPCQQSNATSYKKNAHSRAIEKCFIVPIDNIWKKYTLLVCLDRIFYGPLSMKKIHYRLEEVKKSKEEWWYLFPRLKKDPSTPLRAFQKNTETSLKHLQNKIAKESKQTQQIIHSEIEEIRLMLSELIKSMNMTNSDNNALGSLNERMEVQGEKKRATVVLTRKVGRKEGVILEEE